MTTNYETAPSPRQYAEQVLEQSQRVLQEAVAIAFPETPDLDPIQAFPRPTELRAESPDLQQLTDEGKSNLLSKASELGFGRPENVTLSEQGLIGATVIIEGGQPHKMLAEARMVVDDVAARPKSIIISASPPRELKNEAEIASAQRLFGRVGRTEYEVAGDVARSLPGFTEYPEPKVLNAAYDINNDNAVSQEPTGQFKAVGEIKGIPVVLMQISRRDLEGGKYDRQPGTAAVIGIVDEVIKASGDDTSPLVHVTSGTYRPSRTLGAALAGLKAKRLVGIATYGNDLLNEIKGDNAPAPISQLPGELHEMAEQAIKLSKALEA
ncbi:MAG TPA: hypothetical protein VFN31_02930 [Candidatus Saccharimonadales bacterium]|nr:hypothetical protein [Candidatus Saccharimonadales bacterium]